MKNRMEVGAILRELRLQNIKCKYDAEQIANEQNFKVSIDQPILYAVPHLGNIMENVYDLPQFISDSSLHFQSEKGLLWDSIKADLEEKIHKLEEDKNNVDFTTGLWEETSSEIAKKRNKLSNDPMDLDYRKKPVTVTGPYIVYLLQDTDIMDDWTLIKKSLTQRRKQDMLRIQ